MKGKLVFGIFLGTVFGALGAFLATPMVAVQSAAPGGTPVGNGDVNADGAIDMADVVHLLWYLFVQGSAPVAIECQPCDSCCPSLQLPATGQIFCYSGIEPLPAIVIDCSSEDLPGQDGFYQAGWPMGGRFVDNGDGTVTDHGTGLTWQQETAPGMYQWPDALLYCENLELGGQADWRLPNVRELHSIVDYGRSAPAIDPAFSAVSEWYWSSTSSPAYKPYACRVRFHHGNIGTDPKSMFYYVRAVRG